MTGLVMSSIASFGAGILFGGGAGVTLTIMIMEAHRKRIQRVRRHRRENELIAAIKENFTKPTMPTMFLPSAADSPDVYVRAKARMAELEESGELAKVRAEYEQANKVLASNVDQLVDMEAKIAITPGEPVTQILAKPVQVLVAKHRLPTPSPLTGLNMSLTVGEEGWRVAKVDPVTQTDLINLKAIRDMDEATA